MWRYLREFLSDPRVIELSRVLWYPILYGLVLTTRPQKSGAKYKTIWNEERDESPLRTITRAQAERLAEIFRGEPDIAVEWGMRYGNPSIASAREPADAKPAATASSCCRSTRNIRRPRRRPPTTSSFAR